MVHLTPPDPERLAWFEMNDLGNAERLKAGAKGLLRTEMAAAGLSPRGFGRVLELGVHATPLAWLQAGCEGVTVLDWDMGLRHLRGLGDHVLLRCDRGAGDRLTALLQHGGIPRVKETGLPPVRRAA